MKQIIWLLPVVLLLIACGAAEDEPYDPCNDETEINFPDPKMEGCVKSMSGISKAPIVLVKDTCHTYKLNCISSGITDLTGLEKMPWITELDLSANVVKSIETLRGLINLELLSINIGDGNIEPLRNLEKMKELNISGYNKIRTVEPLSKMTSLEKLFIGNNELADITSIGLLTKLSVLSMDGNKITDISPIKSLLELLHINIEGNCITDFSTIDYLKQNGNLKSITGATATEQDYNRCK